MKKLFSMGLLCFCLQGFAGALLPDSGPVHIDDEQGYELKQSVVTSLPDLKGEARQLTITTDSPLPTTFQIVAVTLKDYQASFYLQPSLHKAVSVKEVTQAQKALLGINGGYFTKDFKPDGFFVLKGAKLAPYVSDPLLSGWVNINDKGHIVLGANTGEHSAGNAPDIMQAGPLLISKGIMQLPRVNDLNPFAMRTVLATSSLGEAVVISTSAISLYTLQNILYQHPTWFGVRKIETAVNLDGGKSTGLDLESSNVKIHVPEEQRVKIVVLFH